MTVQTIDVGENHYVNSTSPTTTPTLTNQVHVSSQLWTLGKFTLPSAPAGEVLLSADLVFRTTTGASAGSVDTETVSLVSGSSWSESTVTWNTRPSLISTIGSVPPNQPINTVVTVPLDISVIGPLAGTTIGIAITGVTTDSLQIWSSRFATVADRPDLVLTYGPAVFSSTTTIGLEAKATVISTGSGMNFAPIATVDALYTPAPAVTISTGIATTLGAGAVQFLPNDPKIHNRGCDTLIAGPAGSTSYFAPDWRYSYAFDSPPAWGVEITLPVGQSIVEFCFQKASDSSFRIKVDGKRVTDLPQMMSAQTPLIGGGAGFMLKIAFPNASVQRKITLENAYLPLRAVYVEPGGTLVTPTPYSCRMIVLGDSITNSSSQNIGQGNGTFVHYLADYVGADDWWGAGIGGTGFNNATPVTFINRITDLNHNPQVIVVFGGINDVNTGLQAQAQAVLDAIQTQNPTAEIYMLGCWVATFPHATSVIQRNTTLQTAAAAEGVPFLNLDTGNVYDSAGSLLGNVGIFINSAADVAAYIGTDALHPNDAGHKAFATYLRDAFAMMAATSAPFPATTTIGLNARAVVIDLAAPTVTPGRAVKSGESVQIIATPPAGITPDTWTMTQSAGPTSLPLGGDGVWTWKVPASYTEETYSFQVTYGVSGAISATTTITFTASRHPMFVVKSGVDVPYKLYQEITAPPTPSAGLFYKLGTPVDDDRLFLAHFYGPTPKRLANVVADGATLAESDYYDRVKLNPQQTVEPQHNAYGGEMRTRPMPLPVYTGPDTWQQDNARREIIEARSIGLDGFFCNVTNTAGDNTVRYNQLRDTAHAEFPGFLVMPELDLSSASTLRTLPVANIAAMIGTFANLACTKYLNDGRMLIGSFEGNSMTLAWWQSLFDALAALPTPVTVAVALQANNFASAMASHASIMYAIGQWGWGADPGTLNGSTTGFQPETATCTAAGIKNIKAIWSQDIRPFFSVYDESLNTEGLRRYWQEAIADNPAITILCTWQDIREGSEFMETELRGRVAADVSGYYARWWREQSQPDILADAVYLSHRESPLSAVPTGPQTATMQQWKPPIAGGRNNTSTPREKVEALVYLTSAAEIRLTSNNSTTIFNAPTGGIFAYLKDAGLGTVKVEVWRSGFKIIDLLSPIEIKASFENDRRDYAMMGSIRGTAGQRSSWPRFETPTPPTSVSPWWAWEDPTVAQMDPLTTGKWYLAHPMGTWYISPQNDADTVADDYWGRVKMYYPPIGATGQNLTGGEITERYARRPQRKNVTQEQSDILDYRQEVRWAKHAGLDAFTYGVEQRRPGSMWPRIGRMMRATVQEAAANPNGPKFYIIPWILGNTGVTGPKLAAGEVLTEAFVQTAAFYLADDFSPMINDPLYAGAFLKIGGKTVFMPYNPNMAPNNQGDTSPPSGREAWGHMWWRKFKERMAANGTPVALWFTQSDSISKWTSNFEDLTSAVGWFGSRDWALSGSSATSFGGANNYLKITSGQTVENLGVTPMPYIAPVSGQGYYRRGATDNSSTFGYIWESRGFLNAYNSWMNGCINQNAEMAQAQTWNDAAEGTQIYPTTNSGFYWIDMFKYFAIRHKTGQFPTIVRDAIYLLHRPQQTTGNHAGGGATYPGTLQTKFATLYHDPATGHTPFNTDSPLVNIVDCCVFLKSAATVEVTSGGIVTTFSGVAGFNRFESPLRLGTVSARIVRSGTAVVSLTSPRIVSATQDIEHLEYVGCTSLPQTGRPEPIIPK